MEKKEAFEELKSFGAITLYDTMKILKVTGLILRTKEKLKYSETELPEDQKAWNPNRCTTSTEIKKGEIEKYKVRLVYD